MNLEGMCGVGSVATHLLDRILRWLVPSRRDRGIVRLGRLLGA
jgi:hypothetical protein